LVIAAPSGAGKSTIVRRLLEREPRLAASVSVTTRQPRPGEVEGRDYLFRDQATFSAMAASGELLEYADVFGRGYGTPRGPVEERLRAGRDVVLDIDWQGWRQLRAALPGDCVGVFILPPSLEALEARLRGRGTDDPLEVARRMNAAREEIVHWGEFDYVLVNDDLAACVERVTYILGAARCTVARGLGAAALASSMLAG
jgi:guanylate kinase